MHEGVFLAVISKLFVFGYHIKTFCWMLYQKRSSWSCKKIFRQKSYKNFSGKFGGNRTKILQNTKNLFALTPMVKSL